MKKIWKKTPETPTEVIRRLVGEAESLGTVAEGAGVDRQNLYRFAAGELGITGKTLDRLAAYFGLVLVVNPSRRAQLSHR